MQKQPALLSLNQPEFIKKGIDEQRKKKTVAINQAKIP